MVRLYWISRLACTHDTSSEEIRQTVVDVPVCRVGLFTRNSTLRVLLRWVPDSVGLAASKRLLGQWVCTITPSLLRIHSSGKNSELEYCNAEDAAVGDENAVVWGQPFQDSSNSATRYQVLSPTCKISRTRYVGHLVEQN